MGSARKSLAAAAPILIIAVLSLSLIVNVPRALAQSGTNVSGLLNSDTTWTQAGSPYTFTGNMAVNHGVTLTIDAGVTVDITNFYLRVNGTLNAVGSPNAKITFNSGQIIFTDLSNSWNQQTNSGCIIQNSIINQTSISSNNPIKIDNCIINSQITVNSSIISNNMVNGEINCHSAIPEVGQSNPPVDSSIVSGNNVIGSIALGYITTSSVTAPSDASMVFNNTVDGSITTASPQGTPQIFNNTVTNGTIGCNGYASIFNNYIYGCRGGIGLYTPRVFGGNLPCYATVENNLIVNNSEGIIISLTDMYGGATNTPTIENNTISGNSIGIGLSGSGYSTTPTIKYNNIESSSNYSFSLGESNNADLSYNWWGTTSQQAITDSIYDFKNDFNLGTVNFVPFLTAPNSQAPSLSIVTSTSPTPTITPSVPELSWLVIVPLILSVFFVAVVAVIVRHRKQLKKS